MKRHTCSRIVLYRRVAAAVLIASMALPQLVAAASSWSPTLLVNTESFQTIDDGDGTTNVEMRFGATLDEKLIFDRAQSRFEFTDDLSVLGTISGSALRIDGNADIWGNFTASGTLTVDGAATFGSTVDAVGDITTDGNLTINEDAGATDAVPTFGNATGNQTLQFINSSQRFEFSKDVSVVGNISGSSLTVDGDFTWGGETYVAPDGQTANGFLQTDGDGNLTWTEMSVGNGSGNILSFHPEYPNAVYFSSGSTYIGQLTASGGTNLENSYVWTSTKDDIQDYWISVRVRLPDNFSSWDPVKPIELRYKTGVANAANNHVSMRIKDTAGANVALTNGNALANTSWTTANITFSGGTWAAKGYMTVYIKLAADNTGNAAAGFVNMNFETTTP